MNKLHEELEKMGVVCGDISVLQDKDGITVARVRNAGEAFVLKHFENAAFQREIENYRRLSELGVPTIRVIACTDSALLLEDLDSSPRLRLGVREDMSDPAVAIRLASWYRQLHQSGYGYVQQYGAGMYDESDLFTPESIAFIQEKTRTQSAPAWRILEQNFDTISARLRAAPRTLIYNDFYHTNMAVARDGSSALMFDYNLLGKGYAYADLRNVTSSLSEEAGRAFIEAYGDFDPEEKLLDDVVSSVISLYLACQRAHFPDWAHALVREIDTTFAEKIERLASAKEKS